MTNVKRIAEATALNNITDPMKQCDNSCESTWFGFLRLWITLGSDVYCFGLQLLGTQLWNCSKAASTNHVTARAMDVRLWMCKSANCTTATAPAADRIHIAFN